MLFSQVLSFYIKQTKTILKYNSVILLCFLQEFFSCRGINVLLLDRLSNIVWILRIKRLITSRAKY